MKYTKAKTEVVFFDNSDVITTSNPNGCKTYAEGNYCSNNGFENKLGSDTPNAQSWSGPI